jgi:hypothetical protein
MAEYERGAFGEQKAKASSGEYATALVVPFILIIAFILFAYWIIQRGLSDTTKAATAPISAVTDAVGGGLKAISDATKGALDAVGGAGSGALSAIGGAGQGAINAIGGAGTLVTETITRTGGAIENTIVSTGGGISQGYTDFNVAAAKSITGTITNVGEGAINVAGGVAAAAGTTFSDWMQAGGNALTWFTAQEMGLTKNDPKPVDINNFSGEVLGNVSGTFEYKNAQGQIMLFPDEASMNAYRAAHPVNISPPITPVGQAVNVGGGWYITPTGGDSNVSTGTVTDTSQYANDPNAPDIYAW